MERLHVAQGPLHPHFGALALVLLVARCVFVDGFDFVQILQQLRGGRQKLAVIRGTAGGNALKR